MNRILVDDKKNKLFKIKENKVTIDIRENTNIKIEKVLFDKYIFNIYNSNLNILNILEDEKDINLEINIFEGNISFNNISYNSLNMNLEVNLNEKDSLFDLYNSVICNKDVTYNIKVKHNKSYTISNVYNNAVTKDDGSICFNVSSYAPKKSKYCNINQDSKIISLNKTNKNSINPVLLIDEFESNAKHAAFIGDFNKNELFYLMTRGINEKDAKDSLIKGLLIGTLDVCFNEKEIIKKKYETDWR